MDVFAKKRDGQICHKYLALARILVLSDEEVKIDWNLELVAKLDIDGAALVTRLLESDRNAAQTIAWG